MNSPDLFDLERFVTAQEPIFATALAELHAGRKDTHWMWFIFPQLAGLGFSSMAQRYAIQNLAEARAYVAHPMLGPRLLACCRALLSVTGKSAAEIMGYPDDMKLRSSMTLFAHADPSRPEFARVLQQYFDGRPDAKTLDLLAGDEGDAS
jgi:uncharacterized protein (DUF1810 family)